MTTESEARYSLRVSSALETGTKGCDAVFSKLGIRRNEIEGVISASIWRMNCGRCSVSEVFEVEMSAELSAGLGSVRDASCEKGMQNDNVSNSGNTS